MDKKLKLTSVLIQFIEQSKEIRYLARYATDKPVKDGIAPIATAMKKSRTLAKKKGKIKKEETSVKQIQKAIQIDCNTAAELLNQLSLILERG